VYEAGSITKLADVIVRSNTVNLLLIGDSLAGVTKTYAIPVDSTITSVIFSASGASMTVQRPDGSTVQPSDPNVSLLSLSGGVVYSIAAPTPGSWGVTVVGSSDFSVNVSGESTLNLSSFRFVEPGGRPGHEGFFPITGLPEARSTSTVDAVMVGDFQTAQFEFRTKTGAPLQSLNLTLVPETTDDFSGTITPPNTSFLVYVTGEDINRTKYQRVVSGLVQPQTVKIIAPRSQDLHPGLVTTETFQVKNLGSADTFTLFAADDKGFLRSISPTTVALSTNETKDIAVVLQPPVIAQGGTSDTLTVTVRSTTTDTNNFAVVTNSVVTLVPGDLNGDGTVDCSDLAIVKASFGKHKNESGFDPRADTNNDGVINVKDLAFVAQKLPTGTHCP